MFDECNSLTSRHRITQGGLTSSLQAIVSEFNYHQMPHTSYAKQS